MNNKLAYTILIAENDNTSFMYYKEVLSNLGYEIIWAQNGQKAVNLFKERNDINLVIMDIEMPILNGYQATSAIKEISPDTPILILTAYAMKSVKETAEKLHCDAFLTKPIRPKDLINAVLMHTKQ